jgi:hypothetical protein
VAVRPLRRHLGLFRLLLAPARSPITRSNVKELRAFRFGSVAHISLSATFRSGFWKSLLASDAGQTSCDGGALRTHSLVTQRCGVRCPGTLPSFRMVKLDHRSQEASQPTNFSSVSRSRAGTWKRCACDPWDTHSDRQPSGYAAIAHHLTEGQAEAFNLLALSSEPRHALAALGGCAGLASSTL